ncbi:MAG: sugar phosphate isomerase/epimerase family protein [Cetobacterium sp.]|uniref:sugar phosphate isomerase/epimerase family protein n=1 Tax=Cetobacterium sp. TaxID=2071632 RepID=UPI003F2E3E50
MKVTGFIDEIDQTFIEELEVAKSLSMNYIELRSINGKNISEIPLNEITNIKNELDKKGLKVSSIGSPIGKIRIEDDFISHLKKYDHILKICEILDVKYIRIFSFFMLKDEKEYYENEVYSRLNIFLEKIKDKNIILLHENEKDIYGDDIESCLKLVKNINNPQFKLIFDMANFVQVGENALKAYETLKEYIEYFHLKDAKMLSNENVLVGTGDGDIEKILLKLHKKNYNGFLSLEPHLTNFSTLQQLELDDIRERKIQYQSGEEAFRLTYKALRNMIETLGGIIC